MNENKVEITVAEYHDLLRKAERIAVLGRMVATGDYISTGDMLAVLDIKKPEKEQSCNGAV